MTAKFRISPQKLRHLIASHVSEQIECPWVRPGRIKIKRDGSVEVALVPTDAWRRLEEEGRLPG